MTSVANRSTIAANTSRSGKNKLMEIGNVPPICGTPIWRFRRRRLLRKNRRLRWRELRWWHLDRSGSIKEQIMNWAMLTAIGQLAAVFIGVPSIIYFAIQLREQNRERRQAAVNALTQQWGDLTRALHENAEFTALFLRGVHSFHDLDAVSKLRFSAFQNRFFKNFEGMYYSRCDSILTPELWGEIERTMSDFLAYHGVRQWWETRKHWHTEEFGRVVDAIIAKGDEPKAYSTYNLREIVAPETSS